MQESWQHVLEDGKIQEEFHDIQILELSATELPWYVDIMNLIVTRVYPPETTSEQTKMLYYESRFYT